MKSPSFQARVRSDIRMRQAHVRTLDAIWGLTPEDEERMHREWDRTRGVESKWTPPSELDASREERLGIARAAAAKRAASFAA